MFEEKHKEIIQQVLLSFPAEVRKFIIEKINIINRDDVTLVDQAVILCKCKIALLFFNSIIFHIFSHEEIAVRFIKETIDEAKSETQQINSVFSILEAMNLNK